ncbi:MAG: acetolactate synthase [Clostridia bacterium]|nr:acetolactate synthase [Clostridia bacterium]
MSVKQISVFLENKPGTLMGMTEVLSRNNVDMRALSLAETTDFGIARFIVSNVLETMTILKDAGYVSSLTPVLMVEIDDKPGALNRVLGMINEAKINVEYMYASLGSKSGKAYMIFRVQDYKAAQASLRGAGIQVLSQDDLQDL